jgi:hypothetical protein
MAENFKTADVISVFMRENNAIELLGRYATLLQAQHDLPRAQTAINENFAMLGSHQCAVPRAPAAEHGQAEHGSQDSRVISAYANGNTCAGTKARTIDCGGIGGFACHGFSCAQTEMRHLIFDNFVLKCLSAFQQTLGCA